MTGLTNRKGKVEILESCKELELVTGRVLLADVQLHVHVTNDSGKKAMKDYSLSHFYNLFWW